MSMVGEDPKHEQNIPSQPADGPTPETDALLLIINEGRVYDDNGPLADLARTLERRTNKALRELAAEAAKQQARRDAEICRGALWLVSAGPRTVAAAPETPEYFAQLIEKEAGL